MRRLLFFLLLSPLCASAQEQEARLALYNTAFGGLSAGIGAVINKPKGAPWKPVFLRALWQGSLGGALHYTGKKTLHLINRHREVTYALPALVLHSAGSSLIESAAYNRPFGQTWHLDYGPARFDFSFRGGGSFKARLLPSVLYGIPYSAQHGRPDWKLSLLSGCVSFRSEKRLLSVSTGGRGEAAGRYNARSIIYTTIHGDDAFRTIAHELVHHFQYMEYQAPNTWFSREAARRLPPIAGRVFDRYVYFDAPYLLIPYLISGMHRPPHYYRNVFEFEAQRFATNRDVRR